MNKHTKEMFTFANLFIILFTLLLGALVGTGAYKALEIGSKITGLEPLTLAGLFGLFIAIVMLTFGFRSELKERRLWREAEDRTTTKHALEIALERLRLVDELESGNPEWICDAMGAAPRLVLLTGPSLDEVDRERWIANKSVELRDMVELLIQNHKRVVEHRCHWNANLNEFLGAKKPLPLRERPEYKLHMNRNRFAVPEVELELLQVILGERHPRSLETLLRKRYDTRLYVRAYNSEGLLMHQSGEAAELRIGYENDDEVHEETILLGRGKERTTDFIEAMAALEQVYNMENR